MERVGGTETIRVNARVVAATNRDLAAEVKGGRFRADLYYRLAVFPIEIPPLRARRPDIARIASAFALDQARALRKPLRGISSEAEAMLVAYDWPGNVRELHNVIERAAILARGDVIRREDLPDLDPTPRAAAAPEPLPAANPEGERGAGSETLEEVERAHIERVLRDAGWIIEGPTGAAAALGLRPSTLRSRMARLGIRRRAARG